MSNLFREETEGQFRKLGSPFEKILQLKSPNLESMAAAISRHVVRISKIDMNMKASKTMEIHSMDTTH